jgi:glycosyltransferase involved in cell wall biosynthesis
MTIFVHRASECLTDHLSHGEGLICFSLLRELSARGNRVFAYTNHDGVREPPKDMTIRVREHRVPANSLSAWEHGWRADRWLHEIEREQEVDLVWRMSPFCGGCPTMPYTGGRPLVIGPMFYDWPKEAERTEDGRARFGLGIGPLVAPLAARGWARTLRSASLVFCATEGLTRRIRPQTAGRVSTLPCIVQPPPELVRTRHVDPAGPLHLIFVGNLHPNKRPRIFCETIQRLRWLGIDARGTILGDGHERAALEQWCRDNQLDNAVRLLGRISNTEVYQHMANADGLISTSFGEPYGRCIAEAMSVGAVPVCHRSGGPADFISHQDDGLLVDQLDSASYADAIAKIWSQPAQWGRISAAALNKASQWTADAVVGQLESALCELRRGRAS